MYRVPDPSWMAGPPEPRHPVECIDCGVVMDGDDDDIPRCDVCGEYLCDDCEISIERETYCEACASEYYARCLSCHEWFDKDQLIDGKCKDCKSDED